MGVAQVPAASSGPTLAEITTQVSNVVRWTQIATTTSSGSSTITFSSIASGYKSFKLVVSGYYAGSGGVAPLILRLNNDSGSNYRYMNVSIANSQSNTTSIRVTGGHSDTSYPLTKENFGGISNTSYAVEISGNETSNNGKMLQLYGTVPDRINSASCTYYYAYGMSNGIWDNTSEINRIDLICSGDTLVNSDSGRVILYGAK